MKKRVDNPFGNDSTPNPGVENEAAPLPERGTGLETGTAGERRGGNPRTEDERIKRHSRVVSATIPQTEGSAVLPDNLERIFKDGVTHVWHKDKDLPDISKMPEYKPKPVNKPKINSMKESWEKNKDVYYLKKK